MNYQHETGGELYCRKKISPLLDEPGASSPPCPFSGGFRGEGHSGRYPPWPRNCPTATRFGAGITAPIRQSTVSVSVHFFGPVPVSARRPVMPNRRQFCAVLFSFGENLWQAVDAVREIFWPASRFRYLVRDRFGAGAAMEISEKISLRFFCLFSEKQRVICTVNPQVPGSNPGRGASLVRRWALRFPPSPQAPQKQAQQYFR